MLPVKFYVGATLSKKALADAVADRLIAEGWGQTFRWDTVEKAEYPAQAEKELKGVAQANVFIGLLPGRLGLATELGIALCNRDWLEYEYGPTTQVILWAPEAKWYTEAEDGLHPSVFYAHPSVVRLIGEDPVETVASYLFNKGRAHVTFEYN